MSQARRRASTPGGAQRTEKAQRRPTAGVARAAPTLGAALPRRARSGPHGGASERRDAAGRRAARHLGLVDRDARPQGGRTYPPPAGRQALIAPTRGRRAQARRPQGAGKPPCPPL